MNQTYRQPLLSCSSGYMFHFLGLPVSTAMTLTPSLGVSKRSRYFPLYTFWSVQPSPCWTTLHYEIEIRSMIVETEESLRVV